MLLDDITARFNGATDLPGLNTTFHRVMRVINDPHTATSCAASVVTLDPPLVASVLRVANSPAYGFHDETKILDTALARIGLRTLRTLAVSSSVLIPTEAVGGLREVERNGYWRHSLGAAVGARLVARYHQPEFEDDAFLAGLLHGIGLSVLDAYFPEVLRQVVSYSRSSRVSFAEAIYATHQTRLNEISAQIMDQWEMNPDLRRTLRNLHKPMQEFAVDELLPHVYTRLGIALATTAGIGIPFLEMEGELEAMLDAIGMDGQDWSMLLTRAEQSFRAFERLGNSRAA
jgi:HD-like signal output (HDOD) protein